MVSINLICSFQLMPIMKIGLLVCLLAVTLCQKGQLEKLGILLQFQKGNEKDLKAYINNLMDPLCPVIQEFNVIVSFQAAEDIDVVQKQLKSLQATIPINYYIAKNKNDQYKFKLPKYSKAQVFYVSSIYINQEQCQDIEEYLALAKKRMVGGILSMVGEVESANSIQVDLRRKESQIFYFDKISGIHYSLVEDIRLIHRHILEVSESSMPEVALMAKDLKPHCEEIFLNFVSSHFYPELLPYAIKFPTTVHIDLDEQTEYEIKNGCIRKFIDILGYVPVYYQRREFTGHLWTNPNLQKIIELKKQQLTFAISQKADHISSRRLTKALKGQTEIQISAASTAAQSSSQSQGEQLALAVMISIVIGLSVALIVVTVKTRKLEAKMKKRASYIQ